MNTTVQTLRTGASQERTAVASKSSTRFKQYVEKLERNRYGIIPMYLLFMACFGGVGAAMAVSDGAFQLGVVALSTVIVEAFILAVLPMRTILISMATAMFLILLTMVF